MQPLSTRDSVPVNDSEALLADVRLALARVVHDVNNPLSVISGNAQLLCELGRVMELDPDLVKPIADIEEASRVLAERIATLAALKELVGAAINAEDRL